MTDPTDRAAPPAEPPVQGTSARPHDDDSGRANAFDEAGGNSGEEYAREREHTEGTREPSGQVDLKATRAPADDAAGRDIPVEAGRRAFVDAKTGEVHGSGSGAGAGGADEEIDAGSPGGGRYPFTGGERTAE